MSKLLLKVVFLALAGGLVTGCASTETAKNPGSNPQAAAAQAAASKYVAIPKNKDNDLRLFYADGRLVKGADALARMNTDADVVLWLAGNQFFAMEEVVRAFQKQHPGIDVGVITLPPGLILKAIQAGGWTYGGKDYPGQPDVYASVNLGHLKTLKQAGLMDQYKIYMHNELQIMTAKGNPKNIKSIKDLARADVRVSNPNPVNEGIMQFYAKKVLQRHGIYDQLAAGKECVACQTTPNHYFTAVHHRETPERIRAGTSDAGIVWKTEVLEAMREGHAIEGVTLPPEDSLRNEVSYAIGMLSNSKHQDAAMKYLSFLATPAGQAAYAKYGFVNASPEELKLKPISG
ncbi:substrate-binding domain-containing protein [Thermithiobacillus tepidarius DSM 3134]|uniref:molybdate ABC transporter substrate-binding protein n=1 Tax=Thermithiobacillus tepidarius TaxID=929 RepID=UPI000427A5ED|nr:substrate-binding domain-containing protein [Thermithiobacillus tepidarius]